MRKRSIYKKGVLDILRSLLIPILLTIAVMGMIIYGLQQTEASSRAEGLRILEDSIRRAVVTAYSVEGRYPDTITHIEEQYGIHIDRSRYLVHYSVFASNIMPNIAVFEVNDTGFLP